MLLGPLYHLTERNDRLRTLTEARRVLRPGGVILAAAISRFASLIDGLKYGLLEDPTFAQIVALDLAEGQHRNPTDHPSYFTTAFFHHPRELAEEIRVAGLELETLLAAEGPAMLVPDLDDWWHDEARRQQLLALITHVETEPSLLGVSPHLMAIGRRPQTEDRVEALYGTVSKFLVSGQVEQHAATLPVDNRKESTMPMTTDQIMAGLTQSQSRRAAFQTGGALAGALTAFGVRQAAAEEATPGSGMSTSGLLVVQAFTSGTLFPTQGDAVSPPYTLYLWKSLTAAASSSTIPRTRSVLWRPIRC